jgi:hypothetical protein
MTPRRLGKQMEGEDSYRPHEIEGDPRLFH